MPLQRTTIQTQPSFKEILALFVSGHEEILKVAELHKLDANSFLSKPVGGLYAAHYAIQTSEAYQTARH